jgi:hypothetical protein
VNSIVTHVGDNTTTFTNGKLQFLLPNGPNPANARSAELTAGGIFSAPILKTGTYADATARDAYYTDNGITVTAGEIIFLTAGAKFQGYDGSGWVDLN